MNQVSSPKLSYRAEIDGLRAIAVVSVILYHAQMVLFGRDWFEGGFIGVDIFFVISGYLITRIILSELESKGSFSFLNFYERRARRFCQCSLLLSLYRCPMRGKSSYHQILLNTLKAFLLRYSLAQTFSSISVQLNMVLIVLCSNRFFIRGAWVSKSSSI